jgi:K+-transporting ATPase KdpF subunit
VRRALYWFGGPVFRRILAVVEASGGGPIMTVLYLVGGLVAIGLLLYLFVALLKPEIFS